MSFSDGLPEFRCTKNVIGVAPSEQTESYIRADCPKIAAAKYFETYPDDREVTVELWKDSNHLRIATSIGYRIFTRADVAKP